MTKITNIIDEYHFLKKKLEKLKTKAVNSQKLQLRRVAQKMAAVYKRLRSIEKECKKRGLSHPDVYIDKSSSYLNKLLLDNPAKPSVKGICNPDGTLYVKSQPIGDETKLDKLAVRSTPDGRLFETPALEGSYVPRRNAN
jgi:hypothetical protein